MKIIDNYIQEAYLDPKTKEKISIAGILLDWHFVGIFWPLWRLIQSAFSDCAKGCGTFKINTVERQACILKCEYMEIKASIGALRHIMRKSEENKDKIIDLIKQLKVKLEESKQRLIDFAQAIHTETEEIKSQNKALQQTLKQQPQNKENITKMMNDNKQTIKKNEDLMADIKRVISK